MTWFTWLSTLLSLVPFMIIFKGGVVREDLYRNSLSSRNCISSRTTKALPFRLEGALPLLI